MIGNGLNVATAGLTAAGKTTHGRLLAAALGYTYVSATDLFLKHLDHLKLLDPSSEGIWFRSMEEVEAAREGDELDDAVEAELIDMAGSRSHTVFDTWALPWLTDCDLVRIWITSDRPSRARKAYVSQLELQLEKLLSVEDCMTLIDRKDESTRDRFLRRHGFDLYTDHDNFDIVVDNSNLIPLATPDCAQKGIRSLASVVLHATLKHMTGSTAHDEALRVLDDDYELLLRSS